MRRPTRTNHDVTSTPNTSPLSYGDRCAVDFDDDDLGPRTRYGFFHGWVDGDPNAAAEAFVQFDGDSGRHAKVRGARPLTDAEVATDFANFMANRVPARIDTGIRLERPNGTTVPLKVPNPEYRHRAPDIRPAIIERSDAVDAAAALRALARQNRRAARHRRNAGEHMARQRAGLRESADVYDAAACRVQAAANKAMGLP
jgi:hypothetical protein